LKHIHLSGLQKKHSSIKNKGKKISKKIELFVSVKISYHVVAYLIVQTTMHYIAMDNMEYENELCTIWWNTWNRM